MKSRTKGEILRCYKAIHRVLAKNGYKPKLQVMDNEASRVLCDYIAKNNIELQLAPPRMHRQNLAERAIRSFKEHFKAFRATCDPLFPANLWDRHLPQIIITLNLLRQSRLHPTLLAYNVIFGVFDYNKTHISSNSSIRRLHTT